MLPSNIAPVDETTKAQVIGGLPAWGGPAVADLMATLTSKETPFPCTFAVTAARKSALKIGFVEDVEDQTTWSALPGVIAEYLNVYQQLGRETSLVVIFGGRGDEPDELAHYRRRFWEVLQYLHDRDPAEWPAEIPRDTDDPYWEFSFAGTPIFVVCNTPAHLRRKSRFSDHFMITFQPRWVFEEIGPLTPRGAAARKVIRNRLRAYDGFEPSAQLGDYGDPTNREWRQYFLGDVETEADEEAMSSCPFLHR
ncbi:YqcI/YcgG family protein [Saccharothrix saharensis]|uniref:YqcI/YcgG family protein n=1 Tax=Saccharothrix saharensis TaxID=571190 RepID=UPI0036A2EC72